jgi:hypothetical protein
MGLTNGIIAPQLRADLLEDLVTLAHARGVEPRAPGRVLAIHFCANSPCWISLRSCRIALRVSSVTIRGPAV